MVIRIGLICFLHYRCSERSIDLDAFRELLPSRCDVGETFCKSTCLAIGRRSGKCVDGPEVRFFVHLEWKEDNFDKVKK